MSRTKELFFLSETLKGSMQTLLNDISRKHAITPQKLLVLHSVHSKRAETVGAIAKLFALHQANVSTLVKTLESEGLLNRVVNKDDVRSNILILSPQGNDILTAIRNDFKERIRSIGNDIDYDLIENGLREAVKLMDSLRESI